MAIVQKIDSNVAGLRFAEEESIKVLPASPVWEPLEPNSYDSFGGEITTVARNPINAGRQRQKGVVTDLDASGGFSTDFTQDNLEQILQGFFFADSRRKPEAAANTVRVTDVNGTSEQYTFDSRTALSAVVAAGGTGYAVGDVVTVSGGTVTSAATFTVSAEAAGVVTAVTPLDGGRYSVTPGNPAATTGGTGTGLTLTVTYENVVLYTVGALVFASGFTAGANNGLKRITTVADNVVTVAENLVDEVAPPAAADLVTVGVQAAAGDIDVDVAGSLPRLTSTTLDFTTLGLIPGEFIFRGGDAAITAFQNAANNGFARVKTIAANELVLDKAVGTPVAEASTTETIRLFFGRVLKNESDPTLIKRRTYQIERTLGTPDTEQPAQIQSEYLVGAVPSELTMNFSTAEKVTFDLSFVATDNEQRTAAQGLKAGTRPALVSGDAFNTSNDFARLKMAILDPVDPNPNALFAFLTEFTVSLNNNVSPNKAISVLGAFEVTAGQFNVEGNATAYFSEVAAVQAVRNNSDVTLDFAVVKSRVVGPTTIKSGVVVDVPLISLGDGRLNVEQDQPITLPLATPAAADRNFNHTLLMVFFDFLPDVADVS